MLPRDPTGSFFFLSDPAICRAGGLCCCVVCACCRRDKKHLSCGCSAVFVGGQVWSSLVFYFCKYDPTQPYCCVPCATRVCAVCVGRVSRVECCRGALRSRSTLNFLRLLTLGAPCPTPKLSSAILILHLDEGSHDPSTQGLFSKKDLALRRFWVKEPRHSEIISAEICRLYRKTRLQSSFLSKKGLFVASATAKTCINILTNMITVFDGIIKKICKSDPVNSFALYFQDCFPQKKAGAFLQGSSAARVYLHSGTMQTFITS